MKRYTVILSDHTGYADYHVVAISRDEAIEKAIIEHCKDDSEEKREERECSRAHQPEAIFVYAGWCKYAENEVKVRLMKRLTNAQIYTLRRLSSGTRYTLRGDRKKALECRPRIRSTFGTDDIAAPSIPVLVRLGLVEYSHPGLKILSTYYPVCLTDAGKEAVATMKIKD